MIYHRSITHFKLLLLHSQSMIYPVFCYSENLWRGCNSPTCPGSNHIYIGWNPRGGNIALKLPVGVVKLSLCFHLWSSSSESLNTTLHEWTRVGVHCTVNWREAQGIKSRGPMDVSESGISPKWVWCWHWTCKRDTKDIWSRNKTQEAIWLLHPNNYKNDSVNFHLIKMPKNRNKHRMLEHH